MGLSEKKYTKLKISNIMDKNLQAFLKICSLFGICLQIHKSYSSRGSRLFNIYIVLLMGIVLLNSILGIMKTKIFNEFIISWTVSTIVFVSQMLTHLIIMYEAVTKHQEHSDFIRLLQDIDVYFKILLKTNANISAIFEEIRSRLIIMMLISKICLILFAGIILSYGDTGYFWWALLSILVMRFRFIQMIMYVEILKYYMLALNKKLNQVVCLKTEEAKQLLDIDFKQLHSIEVIRNIKQIYASIYEASTLMNAFAQAFLFAASASNFLDCTCHIYWILLTLDNVLPPYNLVSSMATILPLGLFVFKFCYICEVLKDESQRTSLLLSRLISNSSSPFVDTTYKNLVHNFCMQLMHQRIVFTGNRFFTFDLKYIFAMCALIATHLIIIIQFSKNDTSHNVNMTNLEEANN